MESEMTQRGWIDRPMNLVLVGFLGSLCAGLATGVGALPALITTRISDRVLNGMLGFAAGVMLAATAFSLLLPGLEMGSLWTVVLGLLLGGVFLYLLDRVIPHEHFIMGPEGPSSSLRRTWLFVFAITLHNFPEGLAVGVGFGSGDLPAGISLAIGIGLQNMPEGLAVALPLMREKYSRGYALLIATASGLVEPIGGLVGAGAVAIAQPVLPLGMAFAAGAMLFVISDEIIPETHRAGDTRIPTFGLMIGFAAMMALDVLFG